VNYLFIRERDRGLIFKAKDMYKTKDKGIIEVRRPPSYIGGGK